MFRFFNSPFKVQTTSLWIGVLIVWLFTSCSSPPSAGTPAPPKVLIQIEVQDDETETRIYGAQVKLTVDNEVFPFLYTDSNGIAVINVKHQLLEEVGRIDITYDGYLSQTHNVSLDNSRVLKVYLVPIVINPTPVLEESPTSTITLTVPTSTIIPVDTSFPQQSPIECDNPDIVPGIFAQLAQEDTFSFIGSSNAEMFECEGVYDRSNKMPPAVKIDYETTADSFAFFSIGISEGFDISSFNEICFLAYTEESNQRFDLRLKDLDELELGVAIDLAKPDQWEEKCVLLDGYPELDLENIIGITLSFNDDFGNAAIWVDDFEFR